MVLVEHFSLSLLLFLEILAYVQVSFLGDWVSFAEICVQLWVNCCDYLLIGGARDAYTCLLGGARDAYTCLLGAPVTLIFATWLFGFAC